MSPMNGRQGPLSSPSRVPKSSDRISMSKPSQVARSRPFGEIAYAVFWENSGGATVPSSAITSKFEKVRTASRRLSSENPTDSWAELSTVVTGPNPPSSTATLSDGPSSKATVSRLATARTRWYARGIVDGGVVPSKAASSRPLLFMKSA